MKRGPWHQCGDKSQRLVIKQIQQGAVVGVIISPRDLTFQNAIQYAQIYSELDAQVLIDQQFYVLPRFTNKCLSSYPINEYRTNVSQSQQITDDDLTSLATTLSIINKNLSTNGLISPALIYEAGRPDIIQLNSRLFAAAKQVGDDLGIATYATVILGRSVTSSDQTLKDILAPVTSLNSDGWYFGFEFEPERIPSSHEAVYRCCVAGLILACTGKPVLHAYAGPMALLSLGFGATATAIGHWQNLWKFYRGRWQPPVREGGGGKAPSRFFSKTLWGTIVYPDEVARLTHDLQTKVLTPSSFSSQVSPGPPFLSFARWDACKHLVNVICSTVADIALTNDPRENANEAIAMLQEAVTLHGRIAGSGINLRDNTNVYQENWRLALNDLLINHSNDFDYLKLLS